MLAVTVRPLDSDERGFDTEAGSLSTVYLYKGRRDEGVFASRRSVWDDTLAAIQSHPWFGTGFGTSATSVDAVHTPVFSSNSQTTREHGNSYLAIAEWVGLLGVMPFYVLVLFVAIYVKKTFSWLRRGGSVAAPIVPLAVMLTAGLIDTMFEDWLFAVGYYLCVFFWVHAFLLVDMLPAMQFSPEQVFLRRARQAWIGRWQPGMPVPGR
jgi:O-antigen ligase